MAAVKAMDILSRIPPYIVVLHPMVRPIDPGFGIRHKLMDPRQPSLARGSITRNHFRHDNAGSECVALEAPASQQVRARLCDDFGEKAFSGKRFVGVPPPPGRVKRERRAGLYHKRALCALCC